MATEIGPLAVRRSIWIDAPPERVWHEFEDFERMRRWFGTGHTLIRYERASRSRRRDRRR